MTRHPISATWPLEMLSTATFARPRRQDDSDDQVVPLNPSPDERQTFEAGRDNVRQGWTGTVD